MTMAATVTMVAGCRVYQPMIPHDISEDRLAEYHVNTCISLEMASPAVKRACITRDNIQSARSQQIWPHGIAVTALIPTAGLVGYRAARQRAGAANVAVAATGIAGYETLGALAPDNRVEAYSRGTAALTCALGDYRTAVAGVRLAVAQHVEFDQKLKEVTDETKALRSAADKENDAAKKAAAYRAANAADMRALAIQTEVESQVATGLADAQLDKFVGQTIEDLNGLLRGTLPTLASLGDSIAALEKVQGTQPAQSSSLYWVHAPTAIIGLMEQGSKPGADLGTSLADLQKAAEDLIQAEAANRVSLDLSHCLMATTALAAAGLYKPMQLGGGNAFNGTTVSIPKGTSQRIPVVGGQQPYSTHVSGTDASMDMSKAPDVTITMQGAVLLEITVKDNVKDIDQFYLIEVFDSLGTRRSLTVKVPKDTSK